MIRLQLVSTILVALFAVTPRAAAGQSVIRGFVTDALTEQPLQSATAVLLIDGDLFRGMATDGDGYFQFSRVPQGSYTLRVSHIGYIPYTEEIHLEGGHILQLTIDLDPQSAVFGELTVEAEAPSGVSAVSAGLESVTPAALRRIPVPGSSGDLAAYMHSVPGVVVQGDRGGLFFVRGGAVDQNLATIDGLPVYMPFHILSFYSAFPEEIVDRVDFYTGGFGARYGTRVSSMMDVTSRNGNKQELSGSASLAPFLSSIRMEGPLLRNRVSLIASARQSIIEQITPDLFGQAMPYRFGDRFAKLHALIGAGNSLSLTVLDSDDSGEIAGTRKFPNGDPAPQVPGDSSEVGWSNTIIGGNWTHRSNRIPLTVSFTAGISRMASDIGKHTRSHRSSGIESVDARLDLTYQLQDAALKAGGLVRKSELTYELNDLFDGYVSSSENLTEASAYSELDFSFWRLQATPGAHLYMLPNRSRFWLEPRARIGLDVANGHRVHAAWGVYHQSMTGLTDERDLGNLFTAWVPVTSDQIPTSMHAIVGWNGQITSWLSAAIEGFYKSYDNLAVPRRKAFPGFSAELQPADGWARGVDVRVEFANRPFWFGSLAGGTISVAHSSVEYETATATYNPAHDRPNQLHALFFVEKGEFTVTVQWQYGSGLRYTPSSGFDQWYLLTPDVDVANEPGQTRILYGEPYSGVQPSYSRVDVWMERRVERGRYVGTLKAGVVNLLNRDNVFYYDLLTFHRIDQLPLYPTIGLQVELR